MLGWIQELINFFKYGLETGGDKEEQPSSCLLSVGIHLRRCALRADPADAGANELSAAAVLCIQEAFWHRLASESSPSPLAIRTLQLFLASPAVREGDWDSRKGLHVPGLKLTSLGYHLAASEQELTAYFGSQIGEPLLRLNGQRLSVTVSQTTAMLSARTAEYVKSACFHAQETDSPVADADDGTDVFAGIEEAAFLDDRKESSLTTSVFLEGTRCHRVIP